MRLIDADALNIDREHFDTYADYSHAFDMIDNAPTIDAVPVRHGEWIDETFKPWGLVHHPFKCNLCGEHAEFASPYCPNCGAKMYETQKKPCDDCQQFDCYGCEYAERKEE